MPHLLNFGHNKALLLYEILFKKHELDDARKDALKAELNHAVVEFRDNPKHAAAPAQMGHLRSRITKSLEIYSQYVKP